MSVGSRAAGRAVALVLVAQMTTACMAGSAAAPRAGPASPSPSATGTSSPPVEVTLAKVRAVPLEGTVRARKVRPVAERAARVVADLYGAGFVAADAPALAPFLDFFRGEARREARADRDRLTLGKAAGRVAEIHHPRARLRVDVLTDLGRNPDAVLASVEFAAKGLTEDEVETPIRHRAEYLLRRFGGTWRIVAYSVKRRVAPDAIPGLPGKGTMFILAIGSDARVGGPVTRSRADSLHVIGIDLRERKASILGIPRDSYVPIPGHGSNKINAALFFGGPELMVRTVEGVTGIRMDGYLLTGFEGFQGVVNGIGGLTIQAPYRIHDGASGAYFRPGPARVDGKRALAFSRARHDVPGGDFGRSLNQGRVLLAALREFREDMARDPLTLFRWLRVARENLLTDLAVDEMLSLLYAAVSIDPSRVRNRVVPGGGGTVGGASVVHLSSGARAMFRDLRRDGVLGH